MVSMSSTVAEMQEPNESCPPRTASIIQSTIEAISKASEYEPSPDSISYIISSLIGPSDSILTSNHGSTAQQALLNPKCASNTQKPLTFSSRDVSTNTTVSNDKADVNLYSYIQSAIQTIPIHFAIDMLSHMARTLSAQLQQQALANSLRLHSSQICVFQVSSTGCVKTGKCDYLHLDPRPCVEYLLQTYSSTQNQTWSVGYKSNSSSPHTNGPTIQSYINTPSSSFQVPNTQAEASLLSLRTSSSLGTVSRASSFTSVGNKNSNISPPHASSLVSPIPPVSLATPTFSSYYGSSNISFSSAPEPTTLVEGSLSLNPVSTGTIGSATTPNPLTAIPSSSSLPSVSTLNSRPDLLPFFSPSTSAPTSSLASNTPLPGMNGSAFGGFHGPILSPSNSAVSSVTPACSRGESCKFIHVDLSFSHISNHLSARRSSELASHASPSLPNEEDTSYSSRADSSSGVSTGMSGFSYDSSDTAPSGHAAYDSLSECDLLDMFHSFLPLSLVEYLTLSFTNKSFVNTSPAFTLSLLPRVEEEEKSTSTTRALDGLTPIDVIPNSTSTSPDELSSTPPIMTSTDSLWVLKTTSFGTSTRQDIFTLLSQLATIGKKKEQNGEEDGKSSDVLLSLHDSTSGHSISSFIFIPLLVSYCLEIEKAESSVLSPTCPAIITSADDSLGSLSLQTSSVSSLAPASASTLTSFRPVVKTATMQSQTWLLPSPTTSSVGSSEPASAPASASTSSALKSLNDSFQQMKIVTSGSSVSPKSTFSSPSPSILASSTSPVSLPVVTSVLPSISNDPNRFPLESLSHWKDSSKVVPGEKTRLFNIILQSAMTVTLILGYLQRAIRICESIPVEYISSSVTNSSHSITRGSDERFSVFYSIPNSHSGSASNASPISSYLALPSSSSYPPTSSFSTSNVPNSTQWSSLQTLSSILSLRHLILGGHLETILELFLVNMVQKHSVKRRGREGKKVRKKQVRAAYGADVRILRNAGTLNDRLRTLKKKHESSLAERKDKDKDKEKDKNHHQVSSYALPPPSLGYNSMMAHSSSSLMNGAHYTYSHSKSMANMSLGVNSSLSTGAKTSMTGGILDGSYFQQSQLQPHPHLSSQSLSQNSAYSLKHATTFSPRGDKNSQASGYNSPYGQNLGTNCGQSSGSHYAPQQHSQHSQYSQHSQHSNFQRSSQNQPQALVQSQPQSQYQCQPVSSHQHHYTQQRQHQHHQQHQQIHGQFQQHPHCLSFQPSTPDSNSNAVTPQTSFSQSKNMENTVLLSQPCGRIQNQAQSYQRSYSQHPQNHNSSQNQSNSHYGYSANHTLATSLDNSLSIHTLDSSYGYTPSMDSISMVSGTNSNSILGGVGCNSRPQIQGQGQGQGQGQEQGRVPNETLEYSSIDTASIEMYYPQLQNTGPMKQPRNVQQQQQHRPQQAHHQQRQLYNPQSNSPMASANGCNDGNDVYSHNYGQNKAQGRSFLPPATSNTSNTSNTPTTAGTRPSSRGNGHAQTSYVQYQPPHQYQNHIQSQQQQSPQQPVDSISQNLSLMRHHSSNQKQHSAYGNGTGTGTGAGNATFHCGAGRNNPDTVGDLAFSNAANSTKSPQSHHQYQQQQQLRYSGPSPPSTQNDQQYLQHQQQQQQKQKQLGQTQGQGRQSSHTSLSHYYPQQHQYSQQPSFALPYGSQNVGLNDTDQNVLHGMDLTLGMGMSMGTGAGVGYGGVAGGGFSSSTEYGIDTSTLEFPNRISDSSFGFGVDLSIGMGTPGIFDPHSQSNQPNRPNQSIHALKSTYSSGFETRQDRGQTIVMGTSNGMNMSSAADYAMGTNRQLNGSSSYGIMNTYSHMSSSYTPDSFATNAPLESNLLMGIRSESDLVYSSQMSQMGLYSTYNQESRGSGGSNGQHLSLNNSRINSMTPSHV